MKRTAINKLNLLCAVLLLIFSCTTKVNDTKIPATTSSEAARQLFEKAMAASVNGDYPGYNSLLKSAVKEDSGFFMANFNLALISQFYNDDAKFREYANRAINSSTPLSKGEELLKDALRGLVKIPPADVTGIGNKIIELYPSDINAYFTMMVFQQMQKDTLGQVETMKKATELADDKASACNSLGYLYISLGNFAEAEKTFDKYIELLPANPNPYDSKGDYYMAVKEYAKAYDSYMAANKIDTLWSFKKAMKAKALADSVLVK